MKLEIILLPGNLLPGCAILKFFPRGPRDEIM